jgi:hypothetical protein
MDANHISSWNHVAATYHGKTNNSPCGYVSPYLLCKMNNMLPLQFTYDENYIVQLEHRSTDKKLSSLPMNILGPFHASNPCHTIHYEEKDMSIMNSES